MVLSLENRWKQRKEDYENAFNRLQEALEEESNDIIIDGVLHRYEFTFELAWKTMKDYLEYMGITQKIGSPREVIQSAFSHGIIEDGNVWIEMMLARNQLSHLYEEETSRKIYEDIKKYYILQLKSLKEKLGQIL